jgi:hypothetical protein
VPGDIEFVHDERPDSDGGARPPRRPTSRRAVAYRLAAVTAVLVALATWALTRPSASPAPREQAVASPSGARTPTPSPSTQRVNVVCRLGAPVANDIYDAMRHYLPSIVIRNLGAFRCVRGAGASGRILFEAISGRYRGLNIDVETTLRVRAGEGASATPGLGAEPGYVLLGRTEAVAAGLQVDVVAYGRRGAIAPLDAMRELGDFISLNVIL